MVDRRLLRSCAATVASLPWREPYGSTQLLRDVVAAKGRNVRLATLPWLAAPHLPCGVWVATGDTDHVFVQRGSTGVHREQIILHEIGHIARGHGASAPTALLGQLLPDIDPATIEQVLQRSRYTEPQEREAELVATLALTRMSHLAAVRRRETPAAGSYETALDRLDQVLGRDP